MLVRLKFIQIRTDMYHFFYKLRSKKEGSYASNLEETMRPTSSTKNIDSYIFHQARKVLMFTVKGTDTKILHHFNFLILQANSINQAA